MDTTNNSSDSTDNATGNSSSRTREDVDYEYD